MHSCDRAFEERGNAICEYRSRSERVKPLLEALAWAFIIFEKNLNVPQIDRQSLVHSSTTLALVL